MLFTFSYILMNFLLALMIMFKSMTEQTGRRRYFKVLNQIGFEETDLKKITHNELFKLYGLCAGISFLYVGIMLLAMKVTEGMNTHVMNLLTVTLLLPLLICMFINIFTYGRAVLKDLTKPL